MLQWTNESKIINPGQLNISSSKLKVMMVGALPWNLDMIKGGVEAVIINLLEGFKNFGNIEVVHVAFTKEIKKRETIRYASNIVIHFIPFKSKLELVEYVLNQKVLHELIETEKPDIIHIQEITPHLLRFLFVPKKNVVVTQHGIMKEEFKYANGMKTRLKGFFKLLVERYVFPIFPHVIFISDYSRNLHQGKLKSFTQIFNPVHPVFFENAETHISEEKAILYVGILSRRKNIGLVIDAMYLLKKTGIYFKLHIAGGFKDSEYESEIMSKVNSYQLHDHIIFHGWISQQQIRGLFHTCNTFILPSLQETLPVSIAEAMALGKIVIASDIGGIPEMFSHGVSGFLFKRNNLDSLIATIQEVLKMSFTSEISEVIKKEAKEKFHPQLIVKNTLLFYQKVLILR